MTTIRQHKPSPPPTAAAPAISSLLFTALLILPFAATSTVDDVNAGFPWPIFSPAAEAAAGDFCSLAASRKECPAPPTYDSIVIEKYVGTWYEIGGTARGKLQKEAGLACYQSQYSLVDASESNVGDGCTSAKILMEERGEARIGGVAKLGVKRVSSAAAGACGDSRRVCSLVGPESPLRDALYGISSIVVEISPTHAAAASVLSQSIVNISTSLQFIQSGLATLATNVSSAQLANGRLSQSLSNKQSDVDTLNKCIRLAMSAHSRLTQLASDLVAAQEPVLQVAQSLLSDVADPSAIAAAHKLLHAARAIHHQANSVLSHLAHAELHLVAMGAASSSIMSDNTEPEPPHQWSSLLGQAVQNYTSPAKLVVSMSGGQLSGPYWILALQGHADTGYDAALVYSCTQDRQSGEIRQSLFILSRSPSLPQESVDRFLNSARLFGISTDCENPYLASNQNCESSPYDIL